MAEYNFGTGEVSGTTFGGVLGGGNSDWWRKLDAGLGVGTDLAGRLADIYATVRSTGKPNANPLPTPARPETAVDMNGNPGQLQGPQVTRSGVTLSLGTLVLLAAVGFGVYIIAKG